MMCDCSHDSHDGGKCRAIFASSYWIDDTIGRRAICSECRDSCLAEFFRSLPAETLDESADEAAPLGAAPARRVA